MPLTWAPLEKHHPDRAALVSALDAPTPFWSSGKQVTEMEERAGTWSKQELPPQGIPIFNAPHDSALSGSRWDPNTNGSGKMLSS